MRLPRTRFFVFAAFVLLVALTGGGSRPDIQSLLLLRPLSVLFAIYGLWAATVAQLRSVRTPLLIVVSLMVLALLQLVPLPYSVWISLPHRDQVVQATELVGLGEIYRPLSLVPDRTWNTFFALFVPLAAILLAALQDSDRRRSIVVTLAAVALLSAVVGFLQAIAGNKMQFYAISHRGFPTGLFANKNHQSIMLLWLMLAICWLATTDPLRRISSSAAIGGAVASILFVFPLVILTGSRAGLLLGVPALGLCGWLLLRAPATQAILRRTGGKAKFWAGLLVALVSGPLLLILGLLAFSGRDSALTRLFTGDTVEDLRFQYLPLMKQMVLDYLPFGSGFGSFERAFNAYEPAHMLTSHYMNQAHNDPVQLAIEGGLPALAILALALVWLARRLWGQWHSPRPLARSKALFLGGSIGMWLAASLVDYPLRTPFAAMTIAILTVLISLPSVASGAGQADSETNGRDRPSRPN